MPSLIHSETYALAMSLGNEGKKASYSNALSGASKFRISKQRALEIVEQVKEGIIQWKEFFKELGVNNSEIKMLENSFKIKE